MARPESHLKFLSYFRNVRIVKNGWISFVLTSAPVLLRTNIIIKYNHTKSKIRSGRKSGLCVVSPKYLNRLFHTLRYVGQCHPESLYGGKGVLKVQCIRVPIDPAELHYLGGGKDIQLHVLPHFLLF